MNGSNPLSIAALLMIVCPLTRSKLIVKMRREVEVCNEATFKDVFQQQTSPICFMEWMHYTWCSCYLSTLHFSTTSKITPFFPLWTGAPSYAKLLLVRFVDMTVLFYTSRRPLFYKGFANVKIILWALQAIHYCKCLFIMMSLERSVVLALVQRTNRAGATRFIENSTHFNTVTSSRKEHNCLRVDIV